MLVERKLERAYKMYKKILKVCDEEGREAALPLYEEWKDKYHFGEGIANDVFEDFRHSRDNGNDILYITNISMDDIPGCLKVMEESNEFQFVFTSTSSSAMEKMLEFHFRGWKPTKMGTLYGDKKIFSDDREFVIGVMFEK